MGNPQEYRHLVQRATEEVFNRGRLEVIDEVFAEDFVHHDAGVSEAVRGRDAFKPHLESYLRAFPDLTYAIEAVVVEGEMAAIHWTGRGTHEGEYLGIEPTGRTVEFTEMQFVRFEDGRIAEAWDLYDESSVLRQLGALSELDGVSEESPP